MKQIIIIISFIISFLYAKEKIHYTKSKNNLENPFFGYKEIIKKKKDENTTAKKIIIPKNLDKLSAKEINKLIEKAKDIAVMNPTNENVRKYLYLQTYVFKKSEEFMNKFKEVILENPEFNIAADIAKGTFAKIAATKEKFRKRKSFWEKMVNKIGLVVFLDMNQKAINEAQTRVLYFIKRDLPNLVIKIISIQEQKELAKMKKVLDTPDIFIIYKNKNNKAKWYRISTGLTTKDEIYNQIYWIFKYVIKEKK